MCGIVGYVGRQTCGELLLEGLRKLEYRGYDSAGIAIHDGTQVVRQRAEGKLTNLESLYRSNPVGGTTGLAHTRWATHGSPVERNAHPHEADGIVLVHNGIIENYAELRSELMAAGSAFASETDTEIVAHLVARAYRASGDLHAAVREALGRVRGSWALVVLAHDDPDRLVVARNASPLVLGLGEAERYAASDVPAILRHTREVIFLEDGDTAVLKAGEHAIFDGTGAAVERAVRTIQWDPISAEKQGYKHFMLKEIHEQPARVIDTLRGRLSADGREVVLPEVELDEAFLRDLDRIVIVACGTSWHAGMVGRYAIEELARVPVEVDLASEFRYRDPVITERTLAIAISQSGETADTLAAIREARARGARALTICNVLESSIARETGNVIYTHAGPEIGVASTKAYTTQLAALQLFAIWLGARRGRLDAEAQAEHVDALRRLPSAMEAALQCESSIRASASQWTGVRGFLFLGRGQQFPTALEGALKLKEISYIHAEGYAAGEMKHGPIALIDTDLPVVVLAPKNRHLEKTMSNLEEVRARGGRIVLVTTESNESADVMAEQVILVPDTAELLQPLVTVIPMQLLAYCIADAKGTDIDQPRNLAKSVTVE